MLSLHVVAVAGQRIDHGDLLDREIGDDRSRSCTINISSMHAVAEALAVLGLAARSCPLDLDGMIEHQMRESRADVAQAGPWPTGWQPLVLVVAPGLHRREYFNAMSRVVAPTFTLDQS
jgi:hypothetical protein